MEFDTETDFKKGHKLLLSRRKGVKGEQTEEVTDKN